MRRNDREVTDWEEITDIIRRCEVCHIAFHGVEYPYVVPLNFGFEVRGKQLFLYFHGAAEGHKHELLRENPKVAFAMEHMMGISGSANGMACRCTAFYESVMGEGILEYMEGEEKIAALHCLMQHYTTGPLARLHFEPEVLEKTAALRLTVHSFTAKRHAAPVDAPPKSIKAPDVSGGGGEGRRDA